MASTPGGSPAHHRRPKELGGSLGRSSGPPSESDPLSPDAIDRVFPIRSVVAIDPSQQQPASAYFRESPAGSEAGANRRRSLSDAQEASSVRSGSIASVIAPTQTAEPAVTQDEPIVTRRFAYKQTEEGHMVVTGIAGAEQMQRCEDEPIHCPGAIQRFGAMVVLETDPKEESMLSVRIASENSKEIIGYNPAELFALPSFTKILSDEQAEGFLDHVDLARGDFEELTQSGPEVSSLIITGPDALQIKLWCAVHFTRADLSQLICEFELEDDLLYPTHAPEDEMRDTPVDTLNSAPTEEEIAESTTSLSRPLRMLRHARRRRGEAAAMEVFNIMSQIQEQLSSAPNLTSFLKVVVGVVKELTGFHRAMVYQFDDSWNGKVVAELVDYRATKDLYKGLNFPASDIPKQARQLYLVNRVRLLYDRDQETARLVCRSQQDLETPLDMTFCFLRAMSPIHIKYLANMAVRASMSISLCAFGELWGLISLHSYGTHGMRVSFPLRKLCRLIGETASRNIERLSYASRLQARKLINTVPTEANPSGYIVASSDDLLKLFDADFGLLSIKDETKVLGNLPDTQEALAVLEYFRVRCFTSVITSQQLSSDFPDLQYAPGFNIVAGALLVPLSTQGKDFIVFFRKAQIRTVQWAGNPYEKTLREGTAAYLEPRKSFKLWSETVVGRSRDWTEEEVETAAVLCLVYGKFIEVWRQKEAALQSSQLTRLLLANASHEVRTPLNAIINYLEIALEGPLDNETRDNLAKSHSASKSLIYVINDLLDLTRTEPTEGHNLIKDETFDLACTIREATEMFRSDAVRKNIDLEVVEYQGFPKHVRGDQSKVRQAVSNVTANAVSYTAPGGTIKVELWLIEAVEGRCDVEIVVQDTGCGMSPAKLDALFRQLEQVEQISTPSQPQDLVTSSPSRAGSEKSALGLGLATVARVIKNMNGQLRLKSEEGKGSRFTIQLSFMLAETPPAITSSTTPPLQAPTSDAKTSSLDDKKEVTLVKTLVSPASGGRTSSQLIRQSSADSVNTTRSGSSGRSEVDRLINAIQSTTVSPSGEAQSPATTRISDEQQRVISPPSAASPSRALQHIAGQEPIEGSIVPLKAVKIGDDIAGITISPPPGAEQIEGFPRIQTLPPDEAISAAPSEAAKSVIGEETPAKFNVLVAEDDPVNSRIINKRLTKLGHAVKLTVNGDECATVFAENREFDCVLMDIQMPIADGYVSTQRIRGTEESNQDLPERHKHLGRVPIFAVSASLVEDKRKEYIDIGFDGWILKPIDFKRLQQLMEGIVHEETREGAAYVPGQWEKGGWFMTKA